MSQLPGTVDDAFATVQLLHSPEVTVVGVSSCFGNAMVGDVTSSAQRLLDRHFPSLGINVASGAAGPADIVVGTHAVASLARALALSADSEAKVDIVALGPLTNVAGLVSQHPELIPRIGKVYFVAGRTPGERFHIGTANIDTLADMNFEKDAAAAAVVLRSGVHVVLVPFRLTTHVQLRSDDLDRLQPSESTGLIGPRLELLRGWLAEVSRPWLQFWRTTWDVDFFIPFDTLAVVAATNPSLLRCERRTVSIIRGPSDKVMMEVANRHEGAGPAVHGHGVATKLFLVVATTATAGETGDPPPGEDATEVEDGGMAVHALPVTYCFEAHEATKAFILDRILAPPDAADPSKEEL